MGNLNCVGKRGLVVIVLMALFATAKSQVMWNLKGGIMQRSYYDDSSYWGNVIFHGDDELEKRIDWMAGLEMEIPLSNILNLETGLRYRNHYSLAYPDEENHGDYRVAKHHLELPLRLTYKQPLGEHFSLHVGVGPYASYALGDDLGKKWNNNLQVGLEPSVAINWACLSLGATYNIPCFYKGYKDENKPAVMLTLGIRFKSHVWKYVGATLLSIATVGAAASYAWSAANSSSYSSSSYSPGNSSYNSRSSSGGNYEEMYRHWERRAQAAYNSLAGHSGGSSTYQNNMRLLREAQREMVKYREKAAKAGITIYRSDWETKSVRTY